MTERLEREAFEILDAMVAKDTAVQEAQWFIQLMHDAFSENSLKRLKPRLIVLGEDIPQELALALCPNTRFILGGSLETTHWSDTLLPRDANPVSRSACGWLVNPHFNMAENALVVTALSSDNRRKLVGLLRAHGIKVAAADMPPKGYTRAGQAAWTESMLRLVNDMERHLHTRFTYRRLAVAIEEKKAIQRGIAAFRQAALAVPQMFPAVLRGIVIESVWYASDRAEWLRHLYWLTKELRTLATGRYIKPDRRPRVLLTGSPVIFPNEKLPNLLEASGLNLVDRVDSLSMQMRIPCPRPRRFESVEGLVRRMAKNRLPWEMSGAWTENRGLIAAVRTRMEKQRVDGIVYHVLKGQVEYDFELPKVEALAASMGVPVFRLETDYQQQDVEQLRIRTEAFCEMLRQNNEEGMRIAQ